MSVVEQTQGCTTPTVSQRQYKRCGYMKSRGQPFSSSAQKRSSVMSLGRIDYLQHRFSKDATLCGRNAPKAGEHKLPEVEEDSIADVSFEPTMVPLPPSPRMHAYSRKITHDMGPSSKERLLKVEVQALRSLLLRQRDCDTRARKESLVQETLLNNLVQCVRTARTFSSTIPPYRVISMEFAIFRERAMHVLNIARYHQSLVEPRELTEGELLDIERWTDDLTMFLSRTDCFHKVATDWLYPTLQAESEAARHYSFLRFYSVNDILHDPRSDKEAYLRQLSNGVVLCQVYNSVVRRSRRPFGLIDKYHQETSIRYRALENLRYWKAAFLYRFDLNLQEFDVHEIYHLTEVGKEQLSRAVELFCQNAIADMVETVKEEEEARREISAVIAIEELDIGESRTTQPDKRL